MTSAPELGVGGGEKKGEGEEGEGVRRGRGREGWRGRDRLYRHLV